MTEDIIPDDVRQFLLLNIDSIAQWEALLLLRADPHTSWDNATIARRLYVSETEASELMMRLSAKNFLASSPTCAACYRAQTPEIENILQRATEIYARHLLPITHLIHSKSRLQRFADAFKLRKD